MENNYKQAVYGVLNKYEIKYTENGMGSNLDEWQNNKSELLNLLRKHPNWNEEALAVIFEVTESREINANLLQDYGSDLFNLSYDLQISHTDRDCFDLALSAATRDYTQTITREQNIRDIKEYSNVTCAIGQKTSRVINAICKKFGIDKHPEYNARFAKLADSLNPLKIKRKVLLSIHPCDYLEMSNRDNSWRSCHCLDNGEYMAGTLSYMNDGVSMIFYTVDNTVTTDYYKAPKRTRQVFCYKDGILLQSRLYPYTNNEEIRNTYRNIVQQTISTCLNVPNLWTLKKKQIEVNNYCETHLCTLHYEDYIYENYKSNVSLLKSVHTEGSKIYIGYTAYCVNCSDVLGRTEKITCSCTDYVDCTDCGERVHQNNICWIDNEPYCENCVEYCCHCGHYTCEEMCLVYNRYGERIYVCESCRDEDFYYCNGCGNYFNNAYGTNLDEGFYCKHCLQNNFYECYYCGEYVRNNDAVEINNCFYCEHCAESIEQEDENERECA